MAKIIVRIDAEGNAKFHVEGVHGPGCISLTEAMEKALGKVTEVKKTPEFYQQATVQQSAYQ